METFCYSLHHKWICSRRSEVSYVFVVRKTYSAVRREGLPTIQCKKARTQAKKDWNLLRSRCRSPGRITHAVSAARARGPSWLLGVTPRILLEYSRGGRRTETPWAQSEILWQCESKNSRPAAVWGSVEAKGLGGLHAPTCRRPTGCSA